MEDEAARGKVLFVHPPALERPPVEHEDVIARDDGDILWLLSVENPRSHLCRDPTVVGPVHQIATHGSCPEIYIVHYKDRSIRCT